MPNTKPIIIDFPLDSRNLDFTILGEIPPSPQVLDLSFDWDRRITAELNDEQCATLMSIYQQGPVPAAIALKSVPMQLSYWFDSLPDSSFPESKRLEPSEQVLTDKITSLQQQLDLEQDWWWKALRKSMEKTESASLSTETTEKKQLTLEECQNLYYKACYAYLHFAKQLQDLGITDISQRHNWMMLMLREPSDKWKDQALRNRLSEFRVSMEKDQFGVWRDEETQRLSKQYEQEFLLSETGKTESLSEKFSLGDLSQHEIQRPFQEHYLLQRAPHEAVQIVREDFCVRKGEYAYRYIKPKPSNLSPCCTQRFFWDDISHHPEPTASELEFSDVAGIIKTIEGFSPEKNARGNIARVIVAELVKKDYQAEAQEVVVELVKKDYQAEAQEVVVELVKKGYKKEVSGIIQQLSGVDVTAQPQKAIKELIKKGYSKIAAALFVNRAVKDFKMAVDVLEKLIRDREAKQAAEFVQELMQQHYSISQVVNILEYLTPSRELTLLLQAWRDIDFYGENVGKIYRRSRSITETIDQLDQNEDKLAAEIQQRKKAPEAGELAAGGESRRPAEAERPEGPGVEEGAGSAAGSAGPAEASAVGGAAVEGAAAETEISGPITVTLPYDTYYSEFYAPAIALPSVIKEIEEAKKISLTDDSSRASIDTFYSRALRDWGQKCAVMLWAQGITEVDLKSAESVNGEIQSLLMGEFKSFMNQDDWWTTTLMTKWMEQENEEKKLEALNLNLFYLHFMKQLYEAGLQDLSQCHNVFRMLIQKGVEGNLWSLASNLYGQLYEVMGSYRVRENSPHTLTLQNLYTTYYQISQAKKRKAPILEIVTLLDPVERENKQEVLFDLPPRDYTPCCTQKIRFEGFPNSVAPTSCVFEFADVKQFFRALDCFPPDGKISFLSMAMDAWLKEEKTDLVNKLLFAMYQRDQFQWLHELLEKNASVESSEKRCLFVSMAMNVWFKEGKKDLVQRLLSEMFKKNQVGWLHGLFKKNGVLLQLLLQKFLFEQKYAQVAQLFRSLSADISGVELNALLGSMQGMIEIAPGTARKVIAELVRVDNETVLRDKTLLLSQSLIRQDKTGAVSALLVHEWAASPYTQAEKALCVYAAAQVKQESLKEKQKSNLSLNSGCNRLKTRFFSQWKKILLAGVVGVLAAAAFVTTAVFTGGLSSLALVIGLKWTASAGAVAVTKAIAASVAVAAGLFAVQGGVEKIQRRGFEAKKGKEKELSTKLDIEHALPMELPELSDGERRQQLLLGKMPPTPTGGNASSGRTTESQRPPKRSTSLSSLGSTSDSAASTEGGESRLTRAASTESFFREEGGKSTEGGGSPRPRSVRG